MIDLDENTSVATAEEVKAIRSLRIVSPMPAGAPNRPGVIIDPDACQVLIGEEWVAIDRGVPATRKLLED